MSEPKLFVGCAHDGIPPKRILPMVHIMRFKIHEFAKRKEKRGQAITTSSLEAHGYSWGLKLYPRGHNKSRSDAEFISAFLCHEGDLQPEPAAKFRFQCKDHEWSSEVVNFAGVDDWGSHNFVQRQEAIDEYLDEDGTLIIDVHLQIGVDKAEVWYPEECKSDDLMRQLYCSPESADVTFIVGGKEFKVHKCILLLRAKTLLNLAEDNNGITSPIEIMNIKVNIFKTMMEYVYCINKTPKIPGSEQAKDLLLAADRFGCIHLKLYAESVLVEKILAPDNCAELLLLADSHSCALLKESAMNMYKSDPRMAMGSKYWTMVQESNRLLTELLAHTLVSCNSSSNSVDGDIDDLDVTSLRKKLQKADLDVDGCRKILVERLKAHVQLEATKGGKRKRRRVE